MSIATAPASPWPARAAYFSTAIFTGSSGAINIAYGWQKGSDLASSLTWAAIAGAVAITLALSWPALVRSLDARRWSAALVALVALALAGSYSVTAALGSAAGGRANASIVETAAADARKRLQDAYDAAKTELGTLPPSRTVAELEALVAGARPRCRIIVQLGRRETVCAPAPALVAELGRSKRRAELEAKIESAARELARTAPAKQANSDARTLARYLQSLGVNTTPERLNDLLVLLSVLMIETGGGLSLAVGMALGASGAGRGEARPNSSRAAPDHPRTPQPDGLNTLPHTPAEHPGHRRPITARAPSGVVEWLAQQGGRAETSRRRLAATLGRSPSAIHDELHRLAASGVIAMSAGPRGTLVALRPN